MLTDHDASDKQAVDAHFSHLPPTVFGISVLLLMATSAISSPVGAVAALAVFSASIQASAMWSVLGPASYSINSLWSVVATFSVGTAGLIGCHMGSGGMISPLDAIKIMAFGPAIWCIAQLPYWAIRLLMNWRITTRDSGNFSNVGISDMLLFTMYCAISLACLQFVTTSGDNFTGVRTEVVIQRFLVPVFVLALVSFLMVCVPAIRLVFWQSCSKKTKTQFLLFECISIGALFFALLPFEPNGAFWLSFAYSSFVGCFTCMIWIHRENGLICRSAKDLRRLEQI